MNKPLVSIVIPFYSNTSGLLIKSVTSACCQTLDNIEVIVVDDFSPVIAADELVKTDDPRIKIIRHIKNCNGAIARNTGIDAAKGDFIAFLDYDDIWYPNKLTEQLRLYNKVAVNVDNPVIYSRCKIIDGSRIKTRPVRAIAENERVGDYLFFSRQIIQTSGIFLKTSMAKKVRFDNLKRHQDYQFCLSLEAHGCQFFMLQQPSYDFIQIHKLNDFLFSKDWLSRYEKFLGQRSIKGFKYLVILRSMVANKKYIASFKYSLKEGLLFSYLKLLIFSFIKRLILGLQ